MLILAFSSRVYVETKYDIMVWLFGVRYYVSMITLDVKGPYAIIKNTFMREEVFKTVTFFLVRPVLDDIFTRVECNNRSV